MRIILEKPADFTIFDSNLRRQIISKCVDLIADQICSQPALEILTQIFVIPAASFGMDWINVFDKELVQNLFDSITCPKFEVPL